jgi:hypothetical protein
MGETPGLHPDQIVRYGEGRKWFGLGPTQLAEKIEKGEVPRPFPLSDTGHAKGWTGRQIIEHHRRLQAAAEQERERAMASSNAERSPSRGAGHGISLKRFGSTGRRQSQVPSASMTPASKGDDYE